MVATLAKRTAFYALVAAIIVISVFPFYYAILTSFKSGTALFRVDYWPTSLSLANYTGVLSGGSFLRNLGNSLLVAGLVVAASLLLAVTASYALARVSFRGRGLLLLTILAVSMFPHIAVLAGLFAVARLLLFGVGTRPVWTIVQTCVIVGSVFFATGLIGEQVAVQRSELRELRRRVEEQAAEPND